VPLLFASQLLFLGICQEIHVFNCAVSEPSSSARQQRQRQRSVTDTVSRLRAPCRVLPRRPSIFIIPPVVSCFFSKIGYPVSLAPNTDEVPGHSFSLFQRGGWSVSLRIHYCGATARERLWSLVITPSQSGDIQQTMVNQKGHP
jgi:hypothetical protein